MNSRSETKNVEKESMMNSNNEIAGMFEPRNEEILFPLENVLPHCAVILVLDTSHSMWGAGLRDMMRSLDHFYKTIQAEQFLNARIDIAAVSMGDNLRMLEEFIPLEHSTLPEMTIRPKGDTPIGQALNLALDRLAEQETVYRRKGWSSVTPQLLLLSDGQSTDEIGSAVARIQALTRAGRLICRVIATGDNPEMTTLHAIAGGQVIPAERGTMRAAFAEIGRIISQTYEAEAESIVADCIDTQSAGKAAETGFLLDGSNIMYWDEARSGVTLKYLLAITRYFDAADTSYQVFFDATARHRLSPEEVAEYEHLLQSRPEQFHQVPAGTRADDFLLVTADGNPACRIMTNDRFRDHEQNYPWLLSQRDRLIPGMVLNDMIFFPAIGLKVSLPDRKNNDQNSY